MTANNEPRELPMTDLANAATSRKELAVTDARAMADALPYRVHMSLKPTVDGLPTEIGPGEGIGEGFDVLMQCVFGSMAADYIESALKRIVNAVGLDQKDLNAAIATIAAIAPRDEYEASLAVQIVTTHAAGQRLMVRALTNSTHRGVQTFGNLATKFQRTELAAREALNKYRTGGVQTVKHVHVNEGGQAIVADKVMYGGVGNANRDE